MQPGIVPSSNCLSDQEINKFQSIINQIQKNASMIAAVVDTIANTSLIPANKGPQETLDMQVALSAMKYQAKPGIFGTHGATQHSSDRGFGSEVSNYWPFAWKNRRNY